MDFGKPLHNLFAGFGDFEKYAAAVVGVFVAKEKALLYAAVDELDRAVVAQKHVPGNIDDGWRFAFGHSENSEQDLMLLRVQMRLGSGGLAQVQEAAKLKAKLREAEVIGIGRMHRTPIISCNDIKRKSTTKRLFSTLFALFRKERKCLAIMLVRGRMNTALPFWTTFEVLTVLFLATLIRSVFGFGEALVAVPLLALVMPVEVAAPIAALVSITVAGIVIVQDWQKIHVRSAGRLVISSLFGIPLGLVLLKTVAEPIVKAILGVVIIAFRFIPWPLAAGMN